MSAGYSAIQWSRHKRVYDACVAGAAAIVLALFALVTVLTLPDGQAPDPTVLAIRASGACAIVLLHVILCIGPAARLWPVLLPVLYNRRHLGVVTFLLALTHATLVVGYYHGFGVVSPLRSLLTSNANWLSLRAFPFEAPGVVALAIMFVMAATSHDFWLRNLSPGTWKRLHMLVYVAYAALVVHVALGALQGDRGVLGPTLMGVGLVVVAVLHLLAGSREVRKDRTHATEAEPAWIDAGDFATIPEGRARIVSPPDAERIAIFKHDGKVCAITNVCKHQGGPLGEGRIVDGCITCPWHGWQYRPHDGCAPPPFTEKVATYQVRIVAGRVQVRKDALPEGTPTTPQGPTEEAGSHAT
jgi:nitrite reductase/ring-hydroxylating ferredoxin subunit/DMSO/TMAO reductase YedYZ heme-binding membrane subunit